jgi:cell division septal protein FtsQ
MKTKRIGANQERHMNGHLGKSRASKLMKRGMLRAVFVIAIAVFAGIAVFRYSPQAFVYASDAVKAGKRLHTNIKITNCSHAAQESLKKALDSLMAVDSFSFDRAKAVKAASMIPEIEKVSIKKIRDRKNRELTTLIRVTERKPVALVHGGGFHLVDRNGIRFTATPGRYYDLPLLVVGNESAGDTVDLEVFNKIRKTCRPLGSTFFQQISQIDLSEGDAVNLTFKSGEAEYVINPGDIEKKMVQIKKLREKLLEKGSDPARIDMRYHRLAVTSAL